MPYKTLEEANPAIRGIKPPVDLAMANHIADMADKITGVDSPWAVAIATFKKEYMVEDGKWVKKQPAEEGTKEDNTGEEMEECPECKAMPGEDGTIEHKPGCSKAMEKSKKELDFGVKAFTHDGKNLLILQTMNAFKDREEEIFSTMSIKEYSKFVDAIGRKDRVRFWHVPGSDFATVIWQSDVGRFLLEVAEVDDTAFGRKMFHAIQHPDEFPDVLPEGWGTSHGYVYRKKDRDADKTYHRFIKFESTVLPAHRASNPYGHVDTKEVDMDAIDEKKLADLTKILGDEKMARNVLDGLGQKSDKLETEVDFKDDTDVEDVGTDEGEQYEIEVDDDFLDAVAARVPTTDAKELTADVKEMLDGFKAEVLKEVAELLTSAVGSKEQTVKDALAGKITLRPFQASKSNGNVVTDPDLDTGEKERGRPKKLDTPEKVVKELVSRLVVPGVGRG